MSQLDLLRPWGQESPRGFGVLRHELDELFDRFGAFAPVLAASNAFPALNLYETEDAYVLTAEVPGVAPEELEISLEGSTVTLRGERKVASEEGASVHRSERPDSAEPSTCPCLSTGRRSRRCIGTACSRCACPRPRNIGLARSR